MNKIDQDLLDRMRIAVGSGPHGLELCDGSRYSIEKRRTLVDADVEYREYGDRYHVRFSGSAGSFELGWFDTRKQAQAAIDSRVACKELL